MVGTNKSLGQHWLKNREILNYIADKAANIEVAEGVKTTCLEIGPGLGTLTSSLLKRFDKVLAVEYDKRLASNLPNSFPGTNLEVVHADILEYDWWHEVDSPYVIAGNIPYYITQPIIGRILESEKKPERAVLLMQKEVAERILATKENTPLSLLVEAQAEVEAGIIVKAREFEPAPKVDSQVVIFKMRKASLVDNSKMAPLYYAGFDHPRKKLMNNLMRFGGRTEVLWALKQAKIDSAARPGDLSLSDWMELDKIMSKNPNIHY